MSVNIEDIKKIKELTGVGLTDAKKALEEANGNFDKALEDMRKKGLTKAEKRSLKETGEGIIDAYIHDGRIGAIVELGCETDFVAKLDDFKTLAHQIAMQVASMDPIFISDADVPEDERAEKQKEFLTATKEDASFSKKPKEIQDKIIDGQVAKYYEDKILINQTFILDDSVTVGQLIKNNMAKLSENVQVKKFSRIEIGSEFATLAIAKKVETPSED
ncbi:elongation factor Ts [Candidatus Saccharibacteria bacterium]|nr:elongation factor Ts [Candidatus Saccharibacteria bacterium]